MVAGGGRSPFQPQEREQKRVQLEAGCGLAAEPSSIGFQLRCFLVQKQSSRPAVTKRGGIHGGSRGAHDPLTWGLKTTLFPETKLDRYL